MLRIVLVVAMAAGLTGPADAGQSPAAGIKVCGLLPAAQVKQLIGGDQMFDRFTPEEEAIGNSGSSCNYAGVVIQVMSFTQASIDALRKRGGLEPVTGLGDEAYFYDNRGQYAELYVKVGARLLTVQRDVPAGQTTATARPGAIALATALVAKLR
jgi:hypothetical protein